MEAVGEGNVIRRATATDGTELPDNDSEGTADNGASTGERQDELLGMEGGTAMEPITGTANDGR